MSKRLIGNSLLLLVAMIWGAAFVAQSVGMDYVEPFTFLTCRNLLGFAVLLPVIRLLDRRKAGAATSKSNKTLWIAGLFCGIFLFGGSALQQLGLLYTTAGKSGFFTSLYIILVPICGLFLGKKPSPVIWFSTLLAVGGLYLLCQGGLALGPGELFTLASALCFALHILVIDHFSSQVDGVRLSCLQFLVVALLSGAVMLLTEAPSWRSILQCWLPICYTGLLSSGAGYTLQIIAQAYTEPTTASLLMSLESVFSVLFGWLLLQQRLTISEFLGCTLVFTGVLLAQLPAKKRAENPAV